MVELMFQSSISPSPPPEMKLTSDSDIDGDLSSQVTPLANDECPLYSRTGCKSGMLYNCNVPDQFEDNKYCESERSSSSFETGENRTEETARFPPSSDNKGENVRRRVDNPFLYRTI